MCYEETYGVKNELSDLLFQIVFYSQLGKEQKLFDFNEICDIISDKLQRHHSQVFYPKTETGTVEEHHKKPNWELHKAAERTEKKTVFRFG